MDLGDLLVINIAPDWEALWFSHSRDTLTLGALFWDNRGHQGQILSSLFIAISGSVLLPFLPSSFVPLIFLLGISPFSPLPLALSFPPLSCFWKSIYTCDFEPLASASLLSCSRRSPAAPNHRTPSRCAGFLSSSPLGEPGSLPHRDSSFSASCCGPVPFPAPWT